MQRAAATALLPIFAAALLAGCQGGNDAAPAADTSVPSIPTTPIEPVPTEVPDQEPAMTVRTKKIDNAEFVSITAALSDAAYAQMKREASTMDPSQRDAYGRKVMGQWLEAFAATYSVDLRDREVHPRYGYAKAFVPTAEFLRLAAAQHQPGLDVAGFASPAEVMTKHPELIMHTLSVATAIPAALKERLDNSGFAGPDEMAAVMAAERSYRSAPASKNSKDILGHRRDAKAPAGNPGFSGLKSIKVKEFEDAVVKRLRAVPTGERVKVGVVDTGIAYGHLSYTAADGKTSRIMRMGEFTGEGRVYFNPKAAMTATPVGDSADLLSLSFQFYQPRTGSQPPPADDLKAIAGLIVKAPPALAAALKAADTKARAGFLSEAAYKVDNPDGTLKEGVDINQNGKTDDSFMVILVPSQDAAGADTSTLYMALTRPALGGVPAHFDFTALSGVQNFNSTLSYMDLFAARFGFQIGSQKIAAKVGDPVLVHSASLVGFDPGLHGSHVAGIIGARKTFINDGRDTKARGVAPLAELQMNRVCANRGGCFNIDNAWMDLANAGVDIINVSIGGLPPINDGYSPQQYLVNRITQEHSVLFAISAGNAGSGYNTTGSPSNAMLAVSVAATATPAMVRAQRQLPGTGDGRAIDQDFVLYFSSRGPTGAGGFKPDIAAPGTEISMFPGNNNPVESSGSGWMHGTSMASPTFAGAAALFLDAVRLYNEKNPREPLPSDALTLRQVLTGSARPFSLAGDKTTVGQGYLWIDQGSGMVDLHRAWEAIFKLRDSKIPSPVYAIEDGKNVPLDLIYEAKIIHTAPNGKVYGGGANEKFARGLWLDYKSQNKVFAVNLGRGLARPYKGADQSTPMRTLAATYDRFILKTRMDGVAKDVSWLKVGVLNQTDCEASKTKATVSIHGKGMVNGKTKNDPLNAFFICVNRSEVAKLPAGEHGAVIELYKTSIDGTKVEALPSLKVPVFLAVPEQKLANATGYALKGKVAGYLSQKRYIDVPKGVTAVEVTISVPPATITKNNTQGCSYILTNIYEADNKSAVPELAARDWVRNCTTTGAPEADASLRTITYTRNNPKPGIWVFDLTGHGTVLESAFEMKVEYAAVKADVAKLGKLNGSFSFDYELSTKSKPDAAKSLYALLGVEQVQRLAVSQNPSKQIPVPTKDGVLQRVFDPKTTKKVVYTTGNTEARDIDLGLLACTKGQDGKEACTLAKQSVSSSSDEKVVLLASEMKPNHYYVPFVVGYSVTDSQELDFTEQLYLVDDNAIDPDQDANELGTIALAAEGERYTVTYSLAAEKAANSRVLNDPLVKAGKFAAFGTLMISAADGFKLLTLPVVLAPQADEGFGLEGFAGHD